MSTERWHWMRSVFHPVSMTWATAHRKVLIVQKLRAAHRRLSRALSEGLWIMFRGDSRCGGFCSLPTCRLTCAHEFGTVCGSTGLITVCGAGNDPLDLFGFRTVLHIRRTVTNKRNRTPPRLSENGSQHLSQRGPDAAPQTSTSRLLLAAAQKRSAHRSALRRRPLRLRSRVSQS